MDKKIPVYTIMYDPLKEEQGLEFVSLVHTPAIMEKGLAFNKHLKFSYNRDKQVVIGPAMIPDVPMYRNQGGEEFYVVFTRESIEGLFEKFMREPRAHKVNVDHDKVVESAFIKSAWIIEDEVHDKATKLGFSLPVGTLMLEVKIEDPLFWEEQVKDAGKTGFSVEGLFSLELVKQQFQKQNETQMEKEFDAKVFLSELSDEARAALVAELSEAKPEVEAEVAEAEVTETAVELAEEKEEEVKAEEPAEEVKEAVMDEAGVRAIVDPLISALSAQVEELLTQVAELKSAGAVEDEAQLAMSSHVVSRAEFIRKYNEKYNG